MELKQGELFEENEGPVEYHNSMHLDQKEVEEWRKLVVGQNAKVLEYFANHPHAEFTGWDASDATGIFIVDTRRAINTLQKQGWLKQVGEAVAKKGHRNYTYKFQSKQ